MLWRLCSAVAWATMSWRLVVQHLQMVQQPAASTTPLCDGSRSISQMPHSFLVCLPQPLQAGHMRHSASLWISCCRYAVSVS